VIAPKLLIIIIIIEVPSDLRRLKRMGLVTIGREFG